MKETVRPAPRAVYSRLFRHFGPQGWWPVTPEGKTAPVYVPKRYGKRPEPEMLEICVGAILTQNTAWTNVEKAIAGLKGADAMRLRSLAMMRRSRLAGLIRPSGYYNQKAQRLQEFARYIIRCHGGSLRLFFDRPSAAVREELLALNGIGPETADSMLLYAAGKPVFVVDAYTRRFGGKFGWFSDTDYHAVQKFFVEALPRSVAVYNEYHALIVALAKDHCRAKPRCAGCPVERDCFHGQRSSD